MACRSEENLSCPVCREIFQDPVLLSCSHSFCNACLQRWWTEKTTLECPLCNKRSSQRDPPRNLALKNLCEDYLQERTQRLSTGTEALCCLHSEKLKLFCFDHQQPLCVICQHSGTHRNHSIRPIDEAAHDCKEVLRELLKLLQEKLELFNDIKGNFDQTAQDIEVQAQDTERQIKDIFLMLQNILQKEEQTRLDAVREEKNQKIQTMRRRSEALTRDIAALSDTVRATEEVLQTEDLSFLQRYNTAAIIAQQSLPDVPQPTPGGLIDGVKHLNNLSIKILDSMKKTVTSTLNPRTADPEPTVLSMLRVRERQSSNDSKVSSPSKSGAVSRRQNVPPILNPQTSDPQPTVLSMPRARERQSFNDTQVPGPSQSGAVSRRPTVTPNLNPQTADPEPSVRSLANRIELLLRQSEATSRRPPVQQRRSASRDRNSLALNHEPNYPRFIPPSERIHPLPVWALAGNQPSNRTTDRVDTEKKKDKRYMSVAALDINW